MRKARLSFSQYPGLSCSALIIVAFICCVIFLAACATTSQPTLWYKPGLDQQEFAKDKYECMQESKTQWAGGGVGIIGLAVMAGSAANAQSQANATFNMCMESRGYTLQVQQENGDSSKTQISQVASQQQKTVAAEVERLKKQINECVERIEYNPPYQGVGKHMPLNGNKSPTLDQLTDAAIPTEEEVQTIMAIHKDMVECREQYLHDWEKLNANAVPIMRQLLSANDLITADLVERKTTWGEANKRRVELRKEVALKLQDQKK